jgi:hypothetical protein
MHRTLNTHTETIFGMVSHPVLGSGLFKEVKQGPSVHYYRMPEVGSEWQFASFEIPTDRHWEPIDPQADERKHYELRCARGSGRCKVLEHDTKV